MKKLLFALSITTAMVSCSSDETIDVVARQPITFGNAFVENSTRAVTDHTYGGGTADENILKTFNVYGTVTGNNNTVNIYCGDNVTGTVGSSTWYCNKIQYWVPNCEYNFIALVDATASKEVTETEIVKNSVTTNTNGMPTSIKYDVRTQADLLFAEQKRTTTTDTSNEANVDFIFNHLLSKVMFTFENGFPDDSDVDLNVTNITIKNGVSKNTYSYKNSSWAWETASDMDASLLFGNTDTMKPTEDSQCANVCLLIPYQYMGDKKLQISFVVNHNKGGTPISLNPEVELNLIPGYSYNLTAVLNSQNVTGVVPIVFKIERDDTWNEEDKTVDYSKDPFQ